MRWVRELGAVRRRVNRRGPWQGQREISKFVARATPRTGRSRAWLLASVVALAGILPITRAEAVPDCRAAGNIAAGLGRLIQEYQAVDRTGDASLSVQDFLVGVTDINTQDRRALEQRGPVKVARTGPAVGSISNDGQAPLEFQGTFAFRPTLFRVPAHIRARYLAGPDKLTLYYAAANALELGEALPFIGIPVFRTVNHVVITRDKLLFFWGSNMSDQPDRCYAPS